ncbi:hypothetical protein ACWFQT_08085 [Cellulosimicrobium cellulans]
MQERDRQRVLVVDRDPLGQGHLVAEVGHVTLADRLDRARDERAGLLGRQQVRDREERAAAVLGDDVAELGRLRRELHGGALRLRDDALGRDGVAELLGLGRDVLLRQLGTAHLDRGGDDRRRGGDDLLVDRLGRVARALGEELHEVLVVPGDEGAVGELAEVLAVGRVADVRRELGQATGQVDEVLLDRPRGAQLLGGHVGLDGPGDLAHRLEVERRDEPRLVPGLLGQRDLVARDELLRSRVLPGSTPRRVELGVDVDADLDRALLLGSLAGRRRALPGLVVPVVVRGVDGDAPGVVLARVEIVGLLEVPVEAAGLERLAVDDDGEAVPGCVGPEVDLQALAVGDGSAAVGGGGGRGGHQQAAECERCRRSAREESLHGVRVPSGSGRPRADHSVRGRRANQDGVWY